MVEEVLPMLDPAVIDYLKRREQERLEQERPQLELPVELPTKPHEKPAGPSSVIVIEL